MADKEVTKRMVMIAYGKALEAKLSLAKIKRGDAVGSTHDWARYCVHTEHKHKSAEMKYLGYDAIQDDEEF